MFLDIGCDGLMDENGEISAQMESDEGINNIALICNNIIGKVNNIFYKEAMMMIS